MFKPGKQAKINAAANKKLKKIYEERQYYCEVRLSDNCLGGWFLTFAHRHKRSFYRLRPKLLCAYAQTVIACVNCHQVIEGNAELTKKIFEKLRGPEIIS
jgi:hypothetical protein